jgi:hypothetical protein
MNTITVIVSAVTAFLIASSGSVGVAFIATKGAMPGAPVWIAAGLLGIGVAAKDTRSLLKLPPVDSKPNE